MQQSSLGSTVSGLLQESKNGLLMLIAGLPSVLAQNLLEETKCMVLAQGPVTRPRRGRGRI